MKWDKPNIKNSVKTNKNIKYNKTTKSIYKKTINKRKLDYKNNCVTTKKKYEKIKGQSNTICIHPAFCPQGAKKMLEEAKKNWGVSQYFFRPLGPFFELQGGKKQGKYICMTLQSIPI